MECKIIHSTKARAGMSAADVVIAVGLVSGLMCMVALNYIYFARSLARMQNYMYMNGKSRFAIDRINRDIRQADSIVSFSTNQLTISLSGTNETFTYNPTQKTLIRQVPGVNELFLTNCNYLRFDVFQRGTTSNSFYLFPATNAASAKVVQIDWICAKKVTGEADTTETIQTATITLRNK